MPVDDSKNYCEVKENDKDQSKVFCFKGNKKEPLPSTDDNNLQPNGAVELKGITTLEIESSSDDEDNDEYKEVPKKGFKELLDKSKNRIFPAECKTFLAEKLFLDKIADSFDKKESFFKKNYGDKPSKRLERDIYRVENNYPGKDLLNEPVQDFFTHINHILQIKNYLEDDNNENNILSLSYIITQHNAEKNPIEDQDHTSKTQESLTKENDNNIITSNNLLWTNMLVYGLLGNYGDKGTPTFIKVKNQTSLICLNSGNSNDSLFLDILHEWFSNIVSKLRNETCEHNVISFKKIQEQNHKKLSKAVIDSQIPKEHMGYYLSIASNIEPIMSVESTLSPKSKFSTEELIESTIIHESKFSIEELTVSIPSSLKFTPEIIKNPSYKTLSEISPNIKLSNSSDIQMWWQALHFTTKDPVWDKKEFTKSTRIKTRNTIIKTTCVLLLVCVGLWWKFSLPALYLVISSAVVLGVFILVKSRNNCSCIKKITAKCLTSDTLVSHKNFIAENTDTKKINPTNTDEYRDLIVGATSI